MYLYQCDKCRKEFDAIGKWNRHLKVHLKPYKCEKCERGFALRSDLDRHTKARHLSGFNRHKCHIQSCGFTASRKDNLTQHLKKAHQWKRGSMQKGDDEESHIVTVTAPRMTSTRISGDEKFLTDEMLFQAARTGSISVLKALLGSGLDLTIRADDGSTVLHCAARSGQSSVVQFLLDNGANSDLTNDPTRLAYNYSENFATRSSFHEAILSGNLETVETFTRHGAHLKDDVVASMCLARCGNAHIVEKCLSYLNSSLDPGVIFDILSEASKMGHVPTVAVILSRLERSIDDLRVQYIPGSSEGIQNFKAPWMIPGVNSVRSYAAMHYAAANGHLEVMQLLGESRITFKLPDGCRCTPLHLAARFRHTNVIEFLLNLPEAHVEKENRHGHTPLQYASMYGALESVQILLQHTKNESAGRSKRFGCSPLQLAAFYGHWEIANFLLEHGDRPEVGKSTDQMYPQSGVVPWDVVKRILEHPDFRDINCFYQPRSGLLHSAVRQADSEMLQLLLDREDVDVNVYNPWGMGTPISLAAELGQIDAVRLLLQHKDIDVNKRPLYKGTPLDIAKKKGLSEIIDLLLVHGAKEGDSFIEANAKSDHEKISTNEDQEDTSSTSDDESGSSREPTIM